MNKKQLLSLSTAVLLMASCSQEELAENHNIGDGLAKATTSSFTAFDEEGTTRSVVDPTTSPIAFKWASGDKLAIYSGGEASGMTNFDLVDGIDSEVATFKANGFLLTEGAQYYAFTPYNGNETNKTQIAVDYKGQVQAQNGSYSHLGAKDFQYSSATTAVTEDANNMTNFNLSHLGAVCRFQLTVPEAGVFTEFTLSGTALASEGILDITSGAFTRPVATDGSITLSLVTSSSSGISVAANGVLTLYMMLPKQNLSGKSLTATLTTNDSKAYSAKLTGKNIEGGHAYGWTASVKVPAKPLLDGTFSVSSTKKVQFTKANLYWDGSAYHFEAKQTDYPTDPWDPNHVGHFYWVSLTDYQSGNANYMPYALSYSYSSRSTSDKFFCGEDNPLTVDGTSGCFALSRSEWDYLISTRTNAANLRKYGVTVGGKANCLIIAPDGFSSTLKSSYTLDEVSSLGLVCLPAAGNRGGSSFYRAESWGLYWSSTPLSSYSYGAYSLNFGSDNVNTNYYNSRSYGHSLRLVRLAQ